MTRLMGSRPRTSRAWRASWAENTRYPFFSRNRDSIAQRSTSSSTTRMFTGGADPTMLLTVARANPPEIESLLDQAAEAYEGGRWDQVLRLAREVLARERFHPEAMHFEATALAERGDVEAGLEAFRRALREAPDDPD